MASQESEVSQEESQKTHDADEEKRLAVLRRLGILDTPPEAVFDRVVKMATEVLEMPIGLVTLIGKDRQWHKAAVGLQVKEIAREHSFCTHAIKEPGPTVVEDLARDERFEENPYVGSLESERSPAIEGGSVEDSSVENKGFRFYGGVSFSVGGQRLGTVCVLDQRPRSLSRKAVRQLRYLAGLVEEELRGSLPEIGSENAFAEQGKLDTTQTKPKSSGPLREKINATRRRFEQTRKWLRACVEATGTALFVVAPDYSATRYVNEAAEELYGVSQGRLQAEPMSWVQHVHPVDRPALEQSIEQQTQGEVQWPVHQEFRVRHPTDGRRWVRVVVRPIRGPGGEVQQLAGIATDVTEEKRRADELRRQNDLFRRAQEIAKVGGWEFQVENRVPESGRSLVTEQTLVIHGLSPETELSPEKSLSFYHPEDRSTIREAFEQAIEEQEPYDLELRLEDANGTTRWVRTRGEPQTEEGEVVRLRGTIQDITDRKRRERWIQQAKQEAEEAARIKTALLSNMNHELRTPLTSILTFAKLIDQNPGAADQFTGRVLGGARRLLYTLNTVMEFAELEGKIETDQHPGTEQRCQLDGTVRSVVADYRAQAQRKGIDMEVEVSKEGPVYLDSYLVERVLTHLVDNSVKFTEQGIVSISVTARGDAVVLQVEDTGVGINPDFLAQAFDEFAQASTGLSRRYEGNGLGLTVAKRLVDRAGGDIQIGSEVGEGTWVTVRLPTGG